MIWVNIEFQVKMMILIIQVFQNGDISILKIEVKYVKRNTYSLENGSDLRVFTRALRYIKYHFLNSVKHFGI